MGGLEGRKGNREMIQLYFNPKSIFKNNGQLQSLVCPRWKQSHMVSVLGEGSHVSLQECQWMWS